MATVFDVLAKDHAHIRGMLAELAASPAMDSGANEDELLLRKRMTEQLVIEESRHEAVEAMYFWPAVRAKLTDGDGLADEGVVQQQTLNEVLSRLDKLDASEAEFEQLLVMFAMAAQDHIEYEENRVWPSLRAGLDTAEAEELGTQLAQAKQVPLMRPPG